MLQYKLKQVEHTTNTLWWFHLTLIFILPWPTGLPASGSLSLPMLAIWLCSDKAGHAVPPPSVCLLCLPALPLSPTDPFGLRLTPWASPTFSTMPSPLLYCLCRHVRVFNVSFPSRLNSGAGGQVHSAACPLGSSHGSRKAVALRVTVPAKQRWLVSQDRIVRGQPTEY